MVSSRSCWHTSPSKPSAPSRRPVVSHTRMTVSNVIPLREQDLACNTIYWALESLLCHFHRRWNSSSQHSHQVVQANTSQTYGVSDAEGRHSAKPAPSSTISGVSCNDFDLDDLGRNRGTHSLVGHNLVTYIPLKGPFIRRMILIDLVHHIVFLYITCYVISLHSILNVTVLVCTVHDITVWYCTYTCFKLSTSYFVASVHSVCSRVLLSLPLVHRTGALLQRKKHQKGVKKNEYMY